MILWNDYQNAVEDDCIEASWGNGVGIIRGAPVPDAAVQEIYRSTFARVHRWFNGRLVVSLNPVSRWFWGRIVAGWTGLRMWQFYMHGLDGWQLRSFGTIARDAASLQAAVAKYKAISVGTPGHQLCVALNDAGQAVYGQVVNAGVVQETVIDWPSFIAVLDKNNFAYTDKFDLPLILNGMKNNWVTWAENAVLGSIFGYAIYLLA